MGRGGARQLLGRPRSTNRFTQHVQRSPRISSWSTRPRAAGARASSFRTRRRRLPTAASTIALVLTQNIAHGREEARKAAERGQTVIVMSGRRPDRSGRRRAREHRLGAGDHPRRSRQRLRPRGRDPRRRRGGGRASIAGGATRHDRCRRGKRRALSVHRELRLRLRGEPHRERGEARQGAGRLRLCGASRSCGLEACDLHPDARRREGRGGHRVHGRRCKHEGVRRRHDRRAHRGPGRRLARGRARAATSRSFASCAASARSSRASISRRWRSGRGRRPRCMIEADRPFSVYADGDPVAELPATDSHPPERPAGDRAARLGTVSAPVPRAPGSGRRSRLPAPPAACRGAPAAAAAPRSLGACSFAWRLTRSSAWGRASPRRRR